MKNKLLVNRTIKEENTLVIYLLLALIISLLISIKISFWPPSIYDAIYTTIILIWTLLAIVKYDTQFFILFFLSIYGFLLVSISSTLIEGGAYMIEIFESGYPTGATARFIFYIQLFTISCYVSYRTLRNSILPFHNRREFINSSIVIIVFNVCFAIILTMLAIILIIYGTPHTTGLGRTKYWTLVAPPGTRYLNSMLPQLNFINGIFLTQNTRKFYRRILVAVLLIALCIQFLQGEKFSGLLLSSYFFALPSLFLKYRNVNLSINFKLIIQVIGLSFLALLSIFVTYAIQYRNALAGLIMIADRISLQGQVMWATDRLTSNAVKNISYFVHQLFGIGADINEKGLNYLMFLIAPPQVSNAYFESGSGFTAGFPSIVLLGTGYIWGIPVILLCGIMMGIVLYVFSLAFTRKKILFSLIALKLFLATYLAFGMGDIYLMVSIKYIVFLTFSVILFYINIILFQKSNKVVKI